MNLSKIKILFNKYFPIILIIVISLLMILISLLLPNDKAMKVYIIIFIITIVLKIIIDIISKSTQIKFPIQDKLSTIEKMYKIFDLENTNTIVAINTKDEKILSKAKKLFPGSRAQKQKGLYSIMLPKVTLKTIKLFLKDNNPERIIIHQFNYPSKDKVKTVTHSLSICIDNSLIIQYNNKQFSKEEIKEIKSKLRQK